MSLGDYKEKNIFYYAESGFTLIELMVSLALGLVISAAAIQLFLLSQRSISTQQALSSVQSDSIFGLETLTRDIRLANLNAAQPYMDDTVLHGGIVLNGKNYTSKRQASPNQKEAAITLTNAISIGSQGPSNLQNSKSDELVIQYKNSPGNAYDCEGREITKNTYVVERYFLREDVNRNDPNAPLALACSALTYTGDEPAEIKFLTKNKGQIIIPRVDHFNVLLAIASDGRNTTCTADDSNRKDGNMDCFGYISIENYKKLTTNPKPQIIAIKVGLLIRSPDTVGENKFFDKNKPYEVLNAENKTAKLIENDRNHLYVRHELTQTIALRNGFGIAQ